MNARIVLTLIATLSCASAFALEPGDLRPKVYARTESMSTAERLKLIALLEENAQKYTSSLEAVSWKSFSTVSGSPEIVAVLTTEAEDTKVLMREFLAQLRVLKKNPRNTGAWLLLLRNYYLVEPYMEDLNERHVVRSDAYIVIRLFLRVVFDRILIPPHVAP